MDRIFSPSGPNSGPNFSPLRTEFVRSGVLLSRVDQGGCVGAVGSTPSINLVHNSVRGSVSDGAEFGPRLWVSARGTVVWRHSAHNSVRDAVLFWCRIIFLGILNGFVGLRTFWCRYYVSAGCFVFSRRFQENKKSYVYQHIPLSY